RRLRAPDFARARFQRTLREGLQALRAADEKEPSYEDAHAWVFCPASFRLLLVELFLLGYTRLEPEYVSGVYGCQFGVVLRRPPADSASLPAPQLERLDRARLALTEYLRH